MALIRLYFRVIPIAQIASIHLILKLSFLLVFPDHVLISGSTILFIFTVLLPFSIHLLGSKDLDGRINALTQIILPQDLIRRNMVLITLTFPSLIIEICFSFAISVAVLAITGPISLWIPFTFVFLTVTNLSSTAPVRNPGFTATLIRSWIAIFLFTVTAVFLMSVYLINPITGFLLGLSGFLWSLMRAERNFSHNYQLITGDSHET